MTSKRMTHDHFFKRFMSDADVAKDFFSSHLPANIQSQVLLDTLTIEPTSFVTPELKNRISDMIYRVKLTNQEDAYLVLLVEHQSKPDPLMPFRLHYYAMQVIDKHIRQHKGNHALPLPPVWPMVFYNGHHAYDAECSLLPLFGEYAPFMQNAILEPFTLIDVSKEADINIRGQKWASILAWCMRYSRQRDFLPYVKEFGQMLRDLAVHAGDARLRDVLYYIASTLDTVAGSDEVIGALLEVAPPELEGDIMTIGEQFYTKGEVHGVAKGLHMSVEVMKLIQQGIDNDTIATRLSLDIDDVQKIREQLVH